MGKKLNMRYATISNPENERKKKEKKRKGRGEKKIYIYDPYTNEMVRITRCAIQSRTDNLYNLKMNEQRGQL